MADVNLDSYLAQIGNSFYAGPNGQSFEIKAVFANRVALEADASSTDLKESLVQLGDYAIVSYGDLNTADFETNKARDSALGYYNGTLWQKYYDSTTNRIKYKEITSLESAPVNLVIQNVQEDANVDPYIIKDQSSTFFNYVYDLHMPKAYSFQANTTEPLNADANATVVAGQLQADGYTLPLNFSFPRPWAIATASNNVAPGVSPSVVATDNHITKTFTFNLPKAWQFAENSTVTTTAAGNNPTVSVGSADSETKVFSFTLQRPWNVAVGTDSGFIPPGDSSHPPNVTLDKKQTGAGDDSNETVYLHFKLPDAWNVALGKVEFKYPNQNPEVAINSSSSSDVTSTTTKYIHFKLPVSQEFQTNSFSITEVGPTEAVSAVVSYAVADTNHHYPQVALSLKRPSKFGAGTSLAQNSSYTESDPIRSGTADYNALADLLPGDFYINTTYAAIHKILTKTSETITTQCLGSMQLALPTLVTNVINPYQTNATPDAQGNQPPSVPTVSTSDIGPVSQWTVNVDTIKAPVFQKSSTSGFVAATAAGEISSRASGDTITYTVKIPKGTRITTQTEEANIANVAKFDGDLYLDNNGQFYQYSANYDRWNQSVSIKGSNFKIKNSEAIVITASDLTNYTGNNIYQKMGAFVSDTTRQGYNPDYAVNLKENELLNISYFPEENVTSSHWLYKSNTIWTGDKLTGDVSNTVVETQWTDESKDDKAYSVTLINSLRSTISSLQTQVANITAAIEQAWGALPISES